MNERKPISIDFFVPGTSPDVKDSIDRKLSDLEAQAEAEAKERAQARSRAEAEISHLADQPDEDDPDQLLEALVQNMKNTGELPPSTEKGPDEVAKDIAHRARTARHNAHITQLRMIEMEQRRQRRAAREGKGKPK